MNEITRIHLGRQPFVIAVDAHKQLRSYLEAIEKQVGPSGKEVVEEVELRMAELLQEHGVTGEKAIVAGDVDYLKEQLGKPGDFRGDSEGDAEESTEAADAETAPKRLFRDTQHGMLAGVSSGLAAYFGLDAVIVRLIFIVLTIAWGWGIALYIILWIVVPEARSTSERLQMHGKPVTVESLKEIVDRADVQGAAERASRYVGPAITKTFRIIAAIIGGLLATVAAIALFGLGTGTTYLVTHHTHLIDNVVAFPVGTSETVFVTAAIALAVLIFFWLFLLGTAMTGRKWALPGWATASIIGLFLAIAAVGTAVGPDAVVSIRDRYNASFHTSTRTVEPFEQLDIKGDLTFRYVKSNDTRIDFRYLGKTDPAKISTKMDGARLIIDARSFNDAQHCEGLCINTDSPVEATIYAPNLKTADLNTYSQVEVMDGDQYWTRYER